MQGIRVGVGLASALALASMCHAQTGEIFALSNGGTGITRVELPSMTTTFSGNVASGQFTTNLAMDANRRLYYMNPFEGSHTMWRADLDSNNQLINQTVEITLSTAGYGVIDGFTIGPDQRLYMTGYGQSQVYAYTPGSNNPVPSTEITLVGGGEFRSDLAFDPFNQKFVGIGIVPDGSGRRSLFEFAGSLAQNGFNDNVTWTYYGGNSSAWATIDLRNTLGGNPDGIAFDPLSGRLFLSGDGERLSEWDRTTAAAIQFIPNGQELGLGYDLAYQQIVPAPASALMLGTLGILSIRRRRA
jgi:hypothetical protein